MPEQGSTNGVLGFAALKDAVPAPSFWHMDPDLAVQYEARRGGSRRHKSARALIVVGTMCLLSNGVEAAISWDFALRALPLRLAVALLCFAGAFLLGGVRRAWQEAVCVIIPILAAMAVTQALGEIAPPRVADRYLVVAPLIVAAFVATVPMRPTSALLLCVLGAVAAAAVFALSAGPLGLPENWDAVLFSAGVMAITLVTARRDEISRRRSFLLTLQHEQSVHQMGLLNAKLLRLSATDMLTGLANRRRFELELEQLWRDQPGADLGVALIDVDHFKLFNDSAGHAAGDACLRSVANAVAATAWHEGDRTARYGGEEFVVLMPGVPAQDLPALGDQLRRAIEDLQMPHPGMPGRHVTISVGLAWRPAAGRLGTPDDFLRDADRALYAAKNAGRNRISMAADWPAAAA